MKLLLCIGVGKTVLIGHGASAIRCASILIVFPSFLSARRSREASERAGFAASSGVILSAETKAPHIITSVKLKVATVQQSDHHAEFER
jgi:hypothetical protein